MSKEEINGRNKCSETDNETEKIIFNNTEKTIGMLSKCEIGPPVSEDWKLEVAVSENRDKVYSTYNIKNNFADESSDKRVPTILNTDEDDKDVIPRLELCECNYVEGSDIVPCYFCFYYQQREKRRRYSLNPNNKFESEKVHLGNLRKHYTKNLRRNSIEFGSDAGLSNDTLAQYNRGSLTLNPSKSGHLDKHPNSPINKPPENKMEEGHDLSREERQKMSTPISIFCAQPAKKMTFSVICGVGLTFLVVEKDAAVITYLNYIALFTFIVFYPIFGLLGTAFIELRKRFKLRNKNEKSLDKNEDSENRQSTNVDNLPDILIRTSRSASVYSRSSSVGILPSITEELDTEEEEDEVNNDGKSVLESHL